MADVSDSERDVDLFGFEYVQDAPKVWKRLRTECPVAHTSRDGGGWLPTTYSDISSIAYDTERFSSRDVGVVATPDGTSLLVAPPITSDPPFHTDARRMLLPYFSPKAVEDMREVTRSIAIELLDAIDPSDIVDAAEEYARYLPVRVIGSMIGLPEEDCEMFTRWAVDILQSHADEWDRRTQATKEILEYFAATIADRRRAPRDDLISKLQAETLPNGDPLTDKHVLGTCFLLLVAGIDTTWSSIASNLLHLATHDDDRHRLAAEPELIPTAVEEFLRAYSPVTMARVAAEDAEISGCPVAAGEKVFLPFGASNRDPEMFEDPDEVVIDRQENRHFAFGIGIHRCLGSNLARMELVVAMEEWLKRFPEFSIAEGADVQWGGTQVRGPRSVPIRVG
ncbi:MAG TPA: cytochrome P450 [Acidimicrobiia bacterium]|nr:cytochrome P450 [Acidimicrobiia bacterium]HIL05172.1 cytochrome P450 [Acidimicrobiia bacterium]